MSTLSLFPKTLNPKPTTKVPRSSQPFGYDHVLARIQRFFFFKALVLVLLFLSLFRGVRVALCSPLGSCVSFRLRSLFCCSCARSVGVGSVLFLVRVS